MATLTDSTNLTGTIILSKATGTKVTLDTDKKYLTKDIELTINAPSSTITTNGATVSYTNGWVNAGSTTVTDSNLVPANIVDGVTIFGVTGNYTGAVIDETPDGNGGTITTITTGINALKTQGKIGITPLTTSQTITPDSGYDALSSVQINAMPAGTEGTPTATKGTVSNHSITITPSVTNTAGYISGSTKTGTAVTVNVTELESGTKTITENGTGISVSGYSTVDVNVATSSEPTELWEEIIDQDIQIVSDSPNYFVINNYTDSFSANETYRVTWGSGGTQYICETIEDTTGGSYDGYVIGSPGAAGYSPDTGEPFIIYKRGATQLAGATTNSAGTFHLKIERQINASISLQAKTNITPTESSQTITPDSGYDALSSVQINAISSTYVGSGITQRSSTDLTASGATVTVPAGYYSAQASKSVTTMTLPTSAASSATSGYTSKATISRSTSAQYINIPPGYNSAGGYYTISATPNGTATAPSSISGTSASITTGTNTITLTKTVSVTPNVSTAGYISSGTAGNSSVSLTASVTVNPTPTASGATVTIPAGYYSAQTTKSVSSGSATGPSTVSGTSATLSTGTNTIILTKTNVTTTPTVSAGYVSSATASTATVTLTANVTTKAAATITPGTSNQTIASGTYLTGTQTIAGDADLVASNIISTANIFGVQGSVVINKYYTGSSAPASNLGNNGDIYLQE